MKITNAIPTIESMIKHCIKKEGVYEIDKDLVKKFGVSENLIQMLERILELSEMNDENVIEGMLERFQEDPINWIASFWNTEHEEKLDNYLTKRRELQELENELLELEV